MSDQVPEIPRITLPLAEEGEIVLNPLLALKMQREGFLNDVPRERIEGCDDLYRLDAWCRQALRDFSEKHASSAQ
jgi:hypothetical protein